MKKSKLFSMLVLCALLVLTGCGKEPAPEATVPAETSPATAAAKTEPPTQEKETLPELPSGPALLEDAPEGKVCVSYLPTRVGHWRYVQIPDQEAAAAAFEKATGAVYSDEWWIKGDKTLGLTVVYRGEFWDFVESGELVCATGRIRAEDAADLLALCKEAALAAGWQQAVTPEQLHGIVSAVLSVKDRQIPLTDPVALAGLEQMLTAGRFSLGGTGCPFSVLLSVTLDSGEEHTVAIAADSCGVWMSEGNYYEFSHDNQAFYGLFGLSSDSGQLVIP